MVGLDFLQFLLNGRMGRRKASESSERAGGPVIHVFLDQVARRLWQEKHAHDQDNGPGKLDGDRNPVTAGIVPVLGRVVDNGSEKEANGDGELICAYNGTANPFGRSLGLV